MDIRQDQADRFDNRIDVFGKTFLGLTVACARCHDHKFDAISTKDYYSLFGFLESSNYRLVRFDSLEHNRARRRRTGRAARARPAASSERALADAARPAVERLADYLLAAREVIQPDRKRRNRPTGSPKAASSTPPCSAAGPRPLRDAAKDAADPLHAWAEGLRRRQGRRPEAAGGPAATAGRRHEAGRRATPRRAEGRRGRGRLRPRPAGRLDARRRGVRPRPRAAGRHAHRRRPGHPAVRLCRRPPRPSTTGPGTA